MGAAIYGVSSRHTSIFCCFPEMCGYLGKGCHLLGLQRKHIDQTAVGKKENNPALLLEQGPGNNL